MTDVVAEQSRIDNVNGQERKNYLGSRTNGRFMECDMYVQHLYATSLDVVEDDVGKGGSC